MPLLRVSAQFFGALANHLDGGQRRVRARDPPPESPATDAAT
jgi:hypothetical protein